MVYPLAIYYGVFRHISVIKYTAIQPVFLNNNTKENQFPIGIFALGY